MAQALKKVEAAEVAPVSPSEGAAVLAMIERVCAMPDVPVERIQQMFTLYQSVDAERARRSYKAAFAKMQPALPLVERNGKGHNDRKYARWEDISAAIMPVLAEHGFGLSFRVSEAANNRVTVTAILSHADGHGEEASFPFPFDTSGSKNAIQAIGSAISYGKRYTSGTLLGLATAEFVDDDGKAACAPPSITDDQAIELRDILLAKNLSEQKFCAHMKVAKLAELPAAKFEDALQQLRTAAAR